MIDKWEALKNQLKIFGGSQQIYVGHLEMMMEMLEKNPEWDLKRDGFKDFRKEAGNE